MARDIQEREAPTRREYVKYGGALLGGTVLAGCTGDTGSESEPTGTGTGDPSTSAGEQSSADSAADERDPFSVTMEPMGEVSFEETPETWMAYFSTYGDMAVALGQLDGISGLVFTENWPTAFYDHLPGVDVSFDDVPQLFAGGGLDKEAFYEMDCDVHLMDPNFISRLADGWEESDYEDIRTNVGPIIGNSIRRRGEDWHDYAYYSLYDAFGRIAQVFDERERYEALARVHEDMRSTIKSELPPAEERPTVGLLSINSDFENGAFYAYPVHDGNGHKQYRDLGMRGAFDDHIDASYGEWDYEKLLEVDPDALLFQYGFSHVSTGEFERRMQRMREDPLGQQLTAVQNDRLYRGGTSYQGPIVNLFQTEVAAKQFYPDTFGEWNGLETLSEGTGRLFEYERVAAIVNGDV
ncbi:ABC transporter substrate-binding protein [Halorarum halophilum]|uniref:ABC transporter substrate-binding protein n=1 Tax=Halorarum halophilum TaxID=2743090 RepID=A0A7D5GFA0_9EURY|nr:ABC transporter substrate-binding protein [Halobaculum halophilum]QLG28068.1 ABC transporter substrate-binding protein [Halobaculum halophilum]